MKVAHVSWCLKVRALVSVQYQPIYALENILEEMDGIISKKNNFSQVYQTQRQWCFQIVNFGLPNDICSPSTVYAPVYLA